MANEVRTKLDTEVAWTITLASLANGSSRQSTIVTNSTSRPAMLVYLRIQSGAVAPSAGATYEVYLIRDDANATVYRSDNAGAADAAITIENSQLIGTIVVTATANKNFYGDFDTAPLGPLGAAFGIAVKNNSGQALNATEGNHLKRFTLYLPEIQ